MNFALSDEQEMLREAAQGALARTNYVEGAREALDGKPLPSIWGIARDAGWTGLLVSEARGGAELGHFDAWLVAEECGKRLTGAGLLGHLAATLVLDRAGWEGDLESLAAGDRRAALAFAEPTEDGWLVDLPGHGQRRGPAPELGGNGLVGAVGFCPDLAGADVLVVATHDGRACVVSPDATGVSLEAVTRFDATRPLGHLRLQDVEPEVVLDASDALASAWWLMQGWFAADALGVCQTTLDMGVEYANDRHTFGRPIGSYQAVKHQLVEILRRIDTIRNLTYYAGYAAQEAPGELPLAACSARFAGEHGIDYATRTCIAVHGGIGATWEHDAPFFWRRAQLSRLLLGGLAGAGDRVAAEIIAKAQMESSALKEAAAR